MRTVKTDGGVTLFMEETQPDPRGGDVAIKDSRVNSVVCAKFAHWLMDRANEHASQVNVTMPTLANLRSGFYSFRVQVVGDDPAIPLPPVREIEAAWGAILDDPLS